MKSKVFALIVLAIVLIACVIIYYLKNYYVNETILKTAVTKSEITGRDYILCQRAWVTGFDWLLIGDSSTSEELPEFCNILGADPFEELDLTYEFAIADNTFVFYVEEKKTYYSDELKEDCTDYVVSGWDVLYPVRHDELFGFLKTNKYIIESDTRPRGSTTVNRGHEHHCATSALVALEGRPLRLGGVQGGIGVWKQSRSSTVQR